MFTKFQYISISRQFWMIQEHMSDIYSWYGMLDISREGEKQNWGSLGLYCSTHYCVYSFFHTRGEKMRNLRSFDQRIFRSIHLSYLSSYCERSIFIIIRCFTWKGVKISAAQVVECKWKIAEICRMPEKNIPWLFAFYRDFSAMSFLFKPSETKLHVRV